MRILLTGVSGFVGAALAPRLLGEEHRVRALARSRARTLQAIGVQARIDAATPAAAAAPAPHAAAAGGVDPLAAIEIVRGDVLSGEGLAQALADVEVAYYLIHSLERPAADGAGGRSFLERERLGALNFATAAARAGVRRIVYLGGPLPPDRALASAHLASRQAVEDVLLEHVPDSVALRAAIVIGARSRSFRLLVRLLERLPAIVLPPWRRFRIRPIDVRDVLAMLAAAADAPAVAGSSLDIGGPEAVSYGELIERIADLMLVARPTFAIGVGVTPLTARLAAALAGEDPGLTAALMDGLRSDLLPDTGRAAGLLGVELHSVDAAIEHALREWEALEPLAAR